MPKTEDKTPRTTRKKDLLEGSITRHVIRLAAPMVIAFLFVTSYHFIDRYFVSQLGDVATAAIGMAFVVQIIIIAIGVGVGSGVNSFIARNLGAKNEAAAKSTAIHSFYLTLAIGILLAIIGLIFQKPLYRFLGAEGELLNLVVEYLTIIFFFTPISLLSVVMNNVYQGWGDTVSPMKFMLTGTLLNLLLDPLLIFGYSIVPAYGIEGAAYATGIGRTFSVLYIFYKLFLRHEPVKIDFFQRFSIDRKIIRGIFQVGFPSTLSQILNSIAMGYIFWVLKPFGDTAKSAYTIVFTYEMVVFLPTIGISQAVTILTGHNFGAKLYDRVNKIFITGALTALSVMAVSAMVVLLMPGFFADIFAQDVTVKDMGAHALSIVIIGTAFNSVYICGVASFLGLGLGNHYLLANILRLYLLQIPVVYIGAMFFAIDGVWWGITLSGVLSSIVLFGWHQYIYRFQILTGKIQPLK